MHNGNTMILTFERNRKIRCAAWGASPPLLYLYGNVVSCASGRIESIVWYHSSTAYSFLLKITRALLYYFGKKKQLYNTSRNKHRHYTNNTNKHTQYNTTPPQTRRGDESKPPLTASASTHIHSFLIVGLNCFGLQELDRGNGSLPRLARDVVWVGAWALLTGDVAPRQSSGSSNAWGRNRVHSFAVAEHEGGLQHEILGNSMLLAAYSMRKILNSVGALRACCSCASRMLSQRLWMFQQRFMWFLWCFSKNVSIFLWNISLFQMFECLWVAMFSSQCYKCFKLQSSIVVMFQEWTWWTYVWCWVQHRPSSFQKQLRGWLH